MDPQLPKSVGLTSIGIAFARSHESNKPENERLFYDPYAKFLTGGSEEFWKSKVPVGQGQKLIGVLLRTRFIDDYVLEIVAKHNVNQIVILGAGMDCRALRLPLPNSVHVYEIDLEEVLKYKKNVLEREKNSIHWTSSLNESNIHYISMDLTTQGAPWKTSLLESSFKKNESTIWILEGLLMYLTSDEIQILIETIGELSNTGSFMVTQNGSPNATAQRILQEMNAPMKSYHTFEQMKELLESCGFTNCKKILGHEMGDWATKRMEERGVKKEELESIFFMITTQKL